ncbi:adenosine kinase-like isoform X2 [Lineus longissimus]|uniref:adenosine kinase-like isoform X2 n=1 Tax=Lineus longissimus TaxID=88925 RepID=UPI00315DA9FA
MGLIRRGLVQQLATRMSTAPANVKEGILLGLGNPLLDITVVSDAKVLKKYELEANNAILAEEKHDPLFTELMQEEFKPQYIAGGATQNSIRVAQWLLQKKYATSFIGCVGNDKAAQILKEKANDVGVKVCYMVHPEKMTGLCGAVITGEDRSLVTKLGAARSICHSFLETETPQKLVEAAQVFYVGGFVLTNSTAAVTKLGQHAAENDKLFVMNLSAPFLIDYFVDPELKLMNYIDILVGNEVEAVTFADKMNFGTKDVKEIAAKTAALPKQNSKRRRTIIFTAGHDPTIVWHEGNIIEWPINKVNPSDIKDTNGCGDSFIGGFLSQLVQGKSIHECLKCGNYAAQTVIQHFGCTYPDHPDF